MGMNSEKLLRAIGDIDEELIAQAAACEIQRAKPVRWVKYTAVAACLCLLLALPIVAARNEMLVDFFSNLMGWRIYTKEYVKDREFSKNVQELAKIRAGETVRMTFDSLVQTEEYLGISLPENPLLAEQMTDQVHMEVESNGRTERFDAPCLVTLVFAEDGSMVAADVDAAYRYDGMHLYVTYRITTQYAASVDGGGISYPTADIADLQTYTTASGRECAVYYTKNAEGICTADGYTVMDGILVNLSLITRAESDAQQAIAALMEAFE